MWLVSAVGKNLGRPSPYASWQAFLAVPRREPWNQPAPPQKRQPISVPNVDFVYKRWTECLEFYDGCLKSLGSSPQGMSRGGQHGQGSRALSIRRCMMTYLGHTLSPCQEVTFADCVRISDRTLSRQGAPAIVGKPGTICLYAFADAVTILQCD